MIEFYTLSWIIRIFITILLGLSVFIQTLAMVLKFYSNRLNSMTVFKNLLEVSILFEILVFSLLHGQIVNGYKNGFLVPSGYENIRILIFLIILLLVIVVSILKKTLLPLTIIPAALISLPIMEKILGPAFPWFFIIALLFFLGRSIKICISSIIKIKTSISSLSVTRAIDNLHTGILFAEKNGYIILSNEKMQNLMFAITGKIFRNSLEFYDALVSDKYESKYKKTELDGRIVYLLPNGTVWMFTKTDIFLGKKNYIHISVADVTELWILTAQLELQEKELRDKRDKLKKTMANLHILSKKKEVENARVRAHDILGQRLTLLLRIIQNEENIDYDLLNSLSKGLLAELKIEQNETRPHDELKSIQQIFYDIGVDIEFEGELPNNIEQAHLWVDIIREGSTNAVRHGFATRINIKSELIDNEYKLTMKNNGYTITSPIIPGSGIKVMRKKVSDQGGNFNIKQHPIFTLSVALPGGEDYE